MITLAEIRERLARADWSNKPLVRLAVLRNVSVEPMESFLQYEALEAGLRCEIHWGAFDQILAEATQPGGPVNEQTEVVLVFAFWPPLAPQHAEAFAGAETARLDAEAEHLRTFVRNVIHGLRQKTSALILWQSFESPLEPAMGILDDQTPNGQTARIHEWNAFLRSELQAAGSAFLVNLDRCRARVGADRFYDHRLWHVARCPWSLAGLQEIARENFKFIRALKGRAKKCLVLDCDNTLWGGIIGEDGLAGIRLGGAYPGSAYVAFQKAILNLYHRGILLALCSKNNENDVWEVFDRHPDMVLKREHLAAWRLNWRDKPENLQELAAELQLTLDALVFADDNPFEIDLVRRLLPSVTVLPLPPDRPHEYAELLAACGLFDTLTVSAEDRARTAMIRAEAERRALQSRAADFEEYLRSLDLRVTLAPADEMSIPRIAQLTQRTNQFNLTTRRYNEEQIRALAQSPDAQVFSLRLADRFGDSGLVGVCILRHQNTDVWVDTFLLSCRVLGRRVEEVFLLECLRRARERGARRAVGEYIPTPKNGQTADFYPRMGFSPLEEKEDGTRRFALDLAGDLPRPPDYFTVQWTS